jgi:hypothetical protein
MHHRPTREYQSHSQYQEGTPRQRKVARVVDDFRAKYGTNYYPNPNVAVEVQLG